MLTCCFTRSRMQCWAHWRWAISECTFRIPRPSGKARTALQFLRHAMELAAEKGWVPVNVDASVILERPKLKDFRVRIRESLAAAVSLPVDAVSVKFKTAEKVGPVGEGRSCECQAVILLAQSGRTSE